MSNLGKIIMFLSSYSPLYLFLITYNFTLPDMKNSIYRIYMYSAIEKMDIMFYILVMLMVLPSFGLYFLVRLSKSGSEAVKIKKISNSNDKVLDYILTYIVSFMTTDFSKMSEGNSKILVTFILIQLLLGYLYCKNNMLYINPLLNIIGFNIYSVETDKNEVIVLTKNKEFYNNVKQEIDIRESSVKSLCCFADRIYISN